MNEEPYNQVPPPSAYDRQARYTDLRGHINKLLNIMEKHFEYVLFIASILTLSSCHEKQSGFEISANLEGFEENSTVLISDISSQQVLDSTQLIAGTFVSNGFLENDPTDVSVVVTSQDGKERSYTSIFIGNEKISMSGDKSSFTTRTKIRGSKYHGFKSALHEKIDPLYEERDKKLQKMFALRNDGKWTDSLQSAYWSETGMITKIDNEVSEITKGFIADNVNSHYALSQLIIYKSSFSKDFVKEQVNRLDAEFKETRYATVLNTYLNNDLLENGGSFHNFVAENQNGQSVDFASFFNAKKYTLLEFYSPHCGWCKTALPEIKSLEKSENEVLQIITYNVDKNKEDWLKTTKSNGITWTTLWNENGRYSDAYTKYRVAGTPTYYLFDKQGTLIDKWNGYDESLIESIKKLIK